MDKMESARCLLNINEHHDNQCVLDLSKQIKRDDISTQTETKSEIFNTANGNMKTDERSLPDYGYISTANGSCGVNVIDNNINEDCLGVKNVEMRKDDELNLASKKMNNLAKSIVKSKRKPLLECTIKNTTKNESDGQLSLMRKGSKSLDDAQTDNIHVLVKEMTDNVGTHLCQNKFKSECSTSMNAYTENSAGKKSFARNNASNNSVRENINEFVYEYIDTKGISSSITSKTALGCFVPNSLAGRNIKSESAFGHAQSHSVADLSLVVPNYAANDCMPIDLSMSERNQNGLKTSNADIMQGMTLVNRMRFDPVPMQHHVDQMTKLQTEFQNQGYVFPAAYALHFQFMINNSMHNMMQMNNRVMSMAASTDGRHNICARQSALLHVNENHPQRLLKVNNKQLEKNVPKDDDAVAVVNNADKNDGNIPAAESDQSLPKREKNVRKPRTNRTCVSKLDGIPLKDDKSNVRDHFVINNLKKLFAVNTNGTVTLDDKEHFKFFVTDNDQIQAIVNSLLEFGILEKSAERDTENVSDMKHICRACNHVFIHAEHLIKHIKKHHVLKKFVCEECNRSFHDAGNYRQHKRVHDDSDIPFECTYCHDFFRHKCTLITHERIHTGEKPFKCEVCGTQFKISSGLKTHMRMHTGETPYACELCRKRFKCQSNLKQHMFQHTQARPFSCEVCGKKYSRKSIRDKHTAAHNTNINSSQHDDKKII